jgi:branched-chain amino acid transport system substrate-binding protein
MHLSLGTVTSGACIAFQGEAKNENMFVLTPSATAVEAIDGDNAFRVCFSDPNQGIASADYIADNKVAEKVAVIYDSSDAYSTGIFEKFAARAKEKSLNIVTAQAFGETKTDFSAQIQSVKTSGAELLFLPIYYSEASLILSQAKTAGLDVIFFGCDGLDGILGMDNFDKSLAEGVMLLTPFTPTAKDERTQNFVKNFTAKYDKAYLNQFGADAYDAIYIIKAAMEKANVTADMDASAICDALKVAMTQITFTGVTGTDITWGADGEPVKKPIAVKIVNGEYVVM